MLCLMPYSVVTNLQVENNLQIRFQHVQLELVVKVNPVAYSTSKALDIQLGSNSLAGSLISRKAILYIEMSMLATQVIEVDNSEDRDKSNIKLAEFQRSRGLGIPAKTLQQLSLLKLCKPIIQHLCRNMHINIPLHLAVLINIRRYYTFNTCKTLVSFTFNAVCLMLLSISSKQCLRKAVF